MIKKLEKAIEIILLIIGIFISGYILINALRYTGRNLIVQEKVRLSNDTKSTLLFLILLTVFFVILVFAEKNAIKYEEKIAELKKVMLPVAAVLFFAAGCLLIFILKPETTSDDAGVLVSEAWNYQHGGYGALKPGGYLSVWPHNAMIYLVDALNWRLFDSYTPFYYFNVLYCTITLVTGALIVREMEKHFHTHFAEPLFVLLFVTNLPTILYIFYLYGDVMSITSMISSGYFLYMYIKKEKNIYLIPMALMIMLGVSYRKTTALFLIASIIVLIFELRKSKRFLVGILVIIISYLAAARLPIRIVWSGTGITPGSGQPYILHIAMGLQDEWAGPGWYNDYNRRIYDEQNGDIEACMRIGKEEIDRRLSAFKEDKAYALDFFNRKLQTQWTEPSYDSLFKTIMILDENIPAIKMLQDDAGTDPLWSYMNIYQSFVYTGFLVYLIYMLITRIKLFKDESDKTDMSEHIFLIAIIGSFLLSIIWEAKSRYCIEAFVMMLPLAVTGYSAAAVKIAKRLAISKKL
ncbi:MAG: hypothetical protein IJ608_10965 [Lachnospiraceae bacterium]|nr:hypothetical protein [Lachnospiraceae bacterium]